jgi:predicted GNAT family N-acyltransferase
VTAGLDVLDRSVAPLFEVRLAQTRDELDAIIQIRARVFRDEQRLVDDDLSDPDDWTGVHAYAVAANRIVSIGRLMLPTASRNDGQIAWVATVPEFRGHGAAGAVMQALLDVADRDRVPTVVISAQSHALTFYRRLGFTPYGSRFLVRGIEHQRMERRLPALVTLDRSAFGH